SRGCASVRMLLWGGRCPSRPKEEAQMTEWSVARLAGALTCTSALLPACGQPDDEGVGERRGTAGGQSRQPGGTNPRPCGAPTITSQVKSHLLAPSTTDDGQLCSQGDPGAIGCNGYTFDGKVRRDAPNDPHYLAYSSRYPRTGALVVYLPGTNGTPVDDP